MQKKRTNHMTNTLTLSKKKKDTKAQQKLSPSSPVRNAHINVYMTGYNCDT